MSNSIEKKTLNNIIKFLSKKYKDITIDRELNDFLEFELSLMLKNINKNHQKDLDRVAFAMGQFKQRKEKEYDKLKRLSNKELIEKIIPIMESLDLSIVNGNQENEVILNQMLKILKKIGVEQIEKSEDLDPNIHEVIFTVKNEDKSKSGKICSVLSNGYLLNGILVRAMQVSVFE